MSSIPIIWMSEQIAASPGRNAALRAVGHPFVFHSPLWVHTR